MVLGCVVTAPLRGNDNRKGALMATQTPDQIAANWASRLGASTQKITDGVQAVTVAPGQAAARQKAAWVANVAAAQDKWASRTAAVPLSTWQNDMINKGI